MKKGQIKWNNLDISAAPNKSYDRDYFFDAMTGDNVNDNTICGGFNCVGDTFKIKDGSETFLNMF